MNDGRAGARPSPGVSIPNRSRRRFMARPSEDETTKPPQVVDGVRVEWMPYYPAATHFETSSMAPQQCQAIDSDSVNPCGNAVFAPFGNAICSRHESQRLDTNDRPAWLFATRAEIEMVDCMRVNGWTAEYFFAIASRARWTRSSSGGSSQIDDISQRLHESTVHESNPTSPSEAHAAMSSLSDDDDVIFMGVSRPPSPPGQHASAPAPAASTGTMAFHIEGELLFNIGVPPPSAPPRTSRTTRLRWHRSEQRRSAASRRESKRAKSNATTFASNPQPKTARTGENGQSRAPLPTTRALSMIEATPRVSFQTSRATPSAATAAQIARRRILRAHVARRRRRAESLDES